MKKTLYATLFLVGLISCSPKNSEILEPKDATTSNSKEIKQETEAVELRDKNPDHMKEESAVMAAFPSGEIAEGSSLYNAHCGKCHELPVVSRYSKEKWQKIVPAMCKEAKLDATQESRIASYVNWKLQQQ